ncbi:hypothetical protein FB595_11618 [Sphingobium sp. AEW010]|nr:hypothetical protein [Sphingobium sp. JAI105]PSO11703.1 hypothetical protein C7E20_09570 [Sphingobium sp. AEW4]TWD01481.1 hypothetical protein FB595_11618 [Sphingobium sp. AEW010]TWD20187.1 hypothetical protein FB596_116105 [Sphingobium sp. AEW013]TWD23090.1 hypothetical protein FB594_11618 [Sphingobium sp. AEW001]
MRIGPVCGLGAAFAAKMNALTSLRTWTKIILPLQGRWLAGGQSEGCRALDRAIPLHHRYAAVPLRLPGKIFVPGWQSACRQKKKARPSAWDDRANRVRLGAAP